MVMGVVLAVLILYYVATMFQQYLDFFCVAILPLIQPLGDATARKDRLKISKKHKTAPLKAGGGFAFRNT